MGRWFEPSTGHKADVAELADALDLGSSALRRWGSSPFIRIFLNEENALIGLAQMVELKAVLSCG